MPQNESDLSRPQHQVARWGDLPNGQPVDAHRLRNSHGASMQILTYGGIITSLEIPDANGDVADVVLGFDRLEPYLARHPYFGAITGRLAGRTTGAQFQLDGKTIVLNANQPPNHLHGGEVGLDRRLWNVEWIDTNPCEICLSYTSPDGEENYPGNVTFQTIYRLTEDHVFEVEFIADSDRPTPVNLTHHGYFNLSGEASGQALDHQIQIHSNQILTVNPDFSLTGSTISADHHPGDFRESKILKEVIDDLYQSHGDLYLLDQTGDGLREAARLHDPGSGRTLTVFTDQPCVQFYTGLHLDSTLVGKSGLTYPQFAGLCLECQGFANGANNPTFGDLLVQPGHPKHQRTHYAFSF